MTLQPALFATAKPAAPMSDWLKDHLVAAGHMTETGVTRKAQLRTCRKCRSAIVVGLDDDVCAFEAHVDPMPLSALGEALALVSGRRTWALRRHGPRFVLDWRDGRAITEGPAGSYRMDVLAAHDCAAPTPDPWTAPTSFAEARATDLPEECPF